MSTTHPVLERAFAALLAHDMPAFTELFSADAVMEFPFAPAERPQRLEGREAVRSYLHDYPDLLDVQRIHDVTVHRGSNEDPTRERLVVEFAASGRVVATSQPYTARYVAVLTLRDGLIEHYRDYWNPVAFADVPVGMGA